MSTTNIAKRAHRILEIASKSKSHIQHMQLHFSGYAEPGYSDPESGIIALGNWNDSTKWSEELGRSIVIDSLPSRIANVFEKMGVSIEWEDEWSSCNDCGKLVRTSADSYSWQPSFHADYEACELLCLECLKEDPETHLKSLEGNCRTCNTITGIDPEKHGYIKLNEDSFETGFHPGQNSDPAKIAKQLESAGITRFLFNLDDTEQFSSSWSVYVHESVQEEHNLDELKISG